MWRNTGPTTILQEVLTLLGSDLDRLELREEKTI